MLCDNDATFPHVPVDGVDIRKFSEYLECCAASYSRACPVIDSAATVLRSRSHPYMLVSVFMDVQLIRYHMAFVHFLGTADDDAPAHDARRR